MVAPKKMKALTFNPAEDTFTLNSLPTPSPGPEDVLVMVEACGLNPVDAKIKFWKTSADSMSRDWVPGLDVSGTIVSVGSKVTDWIVGDRVLYHGNMFRPQGGLAEFSLQKASLMLPHPKFTPAVAASVPCAGWTAWGALVQKLKIRPGASLLVLGGAGGVGSFSLQIGRHFGVFPLAATCSPENFEYVKNWGADLVFDRGRDDLKIALLENNRGFDYVLDAVGGSSAPLAASVLSWSGEMAELVDLCEPSKAEGAFDRCLSFHQFSLGSAYRWGRKAEESLLEAGRSVCSLLEEGRIKAPRLETVGLEKAGEALMEMLNCKTVGKIVAII